MLPSLLGCFNATDYTAHKFSLGFYFVFEGMWHICQLMSCVHNVSGFVASEDFHSS